MTIMTTVVQDRYIVVSADMHAGASVFDYKPYLDSKWHDEPTVEEVRTPLVHLPKVPEESRCAVFIPGYPGF